LAGVLTGSVKQDRVDEAGNRVLSFNVSIDKANRENDLSEDERDDRKLLLRAYAITSDIFKATATLRPDGSLARLSLRVRERPDKQSTIDVLVELLTDEQAAVTTTPPLEPPARESTIRVSSLAELRGSILEFLAPATAPQLPVGTGPPLVPPGNAP
jgi:hypothetical protein